MHTRPSLRYTAPEHATDLEPAALAERYPFLPTADQWDLPDWLARASCGFAPGPAAVRLADRRSVPTTWLCGRGAVAPRLHPADKRRVGLESRGAGDGRRRDPRGAAQA